MQKMTTAQQWAHAAREECGEEPVQELPIEYQQHTIVFDKEKATQFPLKWDKELGIEFLLDAPEEIDCKVYPLS